MRVVRAAAVVVVVVGSSTAGAATASVSEGSRRRWRLPVVARGPPAAIWPMREEDKAVAGSRHPFPPPQWWTSSRCVRRRRGSAVSTFQVRPDTAVLRRV